MAASSSIPSSSMSSPLPPSLGAAEPIGKALAITLNVEDGSGGFLNCRTPVLELFRERMMFQLNLRSHTDPLFFSRMVDVFTSKSSLTTPSLSDLFSKFSNSQQYTQTAKPDQLGSKSSNLAQSKFSTACFTRIFADAIKTHDLTDLVKFVEHMQHYQENLVSEMRFLLRNYAPMSLESSISQSSTHLEIIKQFSERGSLDMTAPITGQFLSEWIRFGADLLKYNDMALLERTPLDFGIYTQPVLPVHCYRMGVKYFIQAIQEVNQLRSLYQMEQFILFPYLKSPATISQFLSPQLHLARNYLQTNTSLSPTLKRNIDFSVLRTLYRLMKVNADLDQMSERFFTADSMKYYTKVLHSREAQIIASTPIIIAEKGTSLTASDLIPTDAPSVYPAFATEHRDVFENFVSRFLSLIDYFSTSGKQAQNDLRVLREMPLFLKFGDMDRLSKRIQSAKGNPQKIDQVIAQEIEKFLVEKNTPIKLREIIPFLRSEGAVLADSKRAIYFQALEKKWAAFPETVASLLKKKTLLAENALKDLFIDSPTPSPKRPTRKPSQQHPSPTTSSSSTSVEQPLSSSSSTSSSTPVQPHPSSLSMQLQESRTLLHSLETQLCKGRHSSTQQALKNGIHHLDDLIISLRRLKFASEAGPVTPPQVFAFVNDCIRHTTLGVEQILSALNRDSNQITDPETLREHLTHDLFVLLYRCNMGDGELSKEVRQWIAEINGGEICVRDVNLFSEERNVLQNLLHANQQFLMGEPDASFGQVTKALDAYLAPLGDFLNSIQYRFAYLQTPVVIEQNLSDTCLAFCEELAAIPIIPLEETASPFMSLRKQMLALQEKDPDSEFASRLSNVQNNLMTHLETELSAASLLEPIEASLHLSNVLLLNQMIVEEMLITTRHHLGVPLSYEELTQHDLKEHVDVLKMRSRFTPEECLFIDNGKASRQWVRYPESITQSGQPSISARGRSKGPGRKQAPSSTRTGRMKDLLGWSRTLSSKQSAVDDVRGYSSVDPAQKKKLAEVRDFALRDVALMSSIVQKVLTHCAKNLQ